MVFNIPFHTQIHQQIRVHLQLNSLRKSPSYEKRAPPKLTQNKMSVLNLECICVWYFHILFRDACFSNFPHARSLHTAAVECFIVFVFGVVSIRNVVH